MKFVHPISGCTEKKFSKILDGVLRAMAEVNRKETLASKEHYQEQRAACDTYIIREIEALPMRLCAPQQILFPSLSLSWIHVNHKSLCVFLTCNISVSFFLFQYWCQLNSPNKEQKKIIAQIFTDQLTCKSETI